MNQEEEGRKGDINVYICILTIVLSSFYDLIFPGRLTDGSSISCEDSVSEKQQRENEE